MRTMDFFLLYYVLLLLLLLLPLLLLLLLLIIIILIIIIIIIIVIIIIIIVMMMMMMLMIISKNVFATVSVACVAGFDRGEKEDIKAGLPLTPPPPLLPFYTCHAVHAVIDNCTSLVNA